MTLTVLRIVFLFLCGLGGWSISQLHEKWSQYPLLGLAVGVTGGLFVVWIDKLLKGFSLRGLSAATFGLFVGWLISYFIGNSVLFSFIEPQPKLIAQIIGYVVTTYLATVIALRGKDEFNLVIPYVKFRREEKPERLVLLDTNVIIDGRVQDVCLTGFLDAVLVIPQFVLAELQYIADAADDVRAARGRRGLEVLKALQQNARVEVKFHENEVPDVKEVDGKLVKLAKMLPAEILTNDFNLNRIAELQHVRVLNLNELAKALRPALLPGEPLTVRLVKEGREPDQAVTYLDDGTMIVVQHARRQIGQEVEVVIDSVLQTAAGRMAFANLASAPSASTHPASRDLAPVS